MTEYLKNIHAKRSFMMKAEYINSFLSAFENVTTQVLNEKISRGKIYSKDKSKDIDGVLISIGVTGDLKGYVMLGMNEDTALNIASKMMCGMKIINFDEIARSAVSELGNMIAGNSAITLFELGKKVDITPPELYTSKDIFEIIDESTVCVPMQIKEDKIEINICLT